MWCCFALTVEQSRAGPDEGASTPEVVAEREPKTPLKSHGMLLKRGCRGEEQLANKLEVCLEAVCSVLKTVPVECSCFLCGL